MMPTGMPTGQDRILMNEMIFYGYHGVLKEENLLGQRFIVSAALTLDLFEAGQSDHVSDTVSYADIYTLIKNIVENKHFKLIEALGQAISSEIMEKFPKVSETSITIKKPEAPIPGVFDFMAVEIRRTRHA